MQVVSCYSRSSAPYLSGLGSLTFGTVVGRSQSGPVTLVCRDQMKNQGAPVAVPSHRSVSLRLTFARTMLPVPRQTPQPNPAVNRTAGKLRLPVRSALARSAGRLLLR
jgi:hypothetical protein